MGFVSVKTGKMIPLKTGYASHQADYETRKSEMKLDRVKTAAAQAADTSAAAQAAKDARAAAVRAAARDNSAIAQRQREEAAQTAKRTVQTEVTRTVSARSSRPTMDLPKAPSLTRAQEQPQDLTKTSYYVSLQNQARQAAVDLDTDALNRTRDKMKDLRAASGRQTLGGVVSGVVPGAAKQYASQAVNVLGTLQETAGAARRRYLPLDIQQKETELTRYLENARSAGDSAERQYWMYEAARAREALEGYQKGFAESRSQGRSTQALADRLDASGAADISGAKEGLGAAGQLAVDVGVAGTQMGLDALTAALLAPITGGSSLAPMAARAFGGGAQEARRSGADLEDQLLYGAGSAALSVATEKISNVAKPFQKMFGKGAAETIAASLVKKFGESGAVQVMQTLSKSAAGRIALAAVGEGFEEAAEDILQPFLKRATYDESARFDAGEAGHDFLVGAILGGLGGGVEVIGNAGAGRGQNQTERGTGAALEAGADVDAPRAAGGVESAVEPVRVGRVTTIKRPYRGQTPVQTQKNAAPVQVDSSSVWVAQNRIDGARGLAETPVAGSGFKTILTRSLQETFRPAKGVMVEGVSFDGRPYQVDIPKNVPGKVVSDPNLSAEKLALLDILPEVVRNGDMWAAANMRRTGAG